MGWVVDDSAPSQLATVTWTRRDMHQDEPEQDTWHGVKWVQKNGGHWLSYDDDGDGTTLVIRPGHVIWVRRGSVEWRHEFASGDTYESVMKTPASAFKITTQTQLLTIDVEKAGGMIALNYAMDLAGQKQVVEMSIQFTKED